MTNLNPESCVPAFRTLNQPMNGGAWSGVSVCAFGQQTFGRPQQGSRSSGAAQVTVNRSSGRDDTGVWMRLAAAANPQRPKGGSWQELPFKARSGECRLRLNTCRSSTVLWTGGEATGQ